MNVLFIIVSIAAWCATSYAQEPVDIRNYMQFQVDNFLPDAYLTVDVAIGGYTYTYSLAPNQTRVIKTFWWDQAKDWDGSYVARIKKGGKTYKLNDYNLVEKQYIAPGRIARLIIFQEVTGDGRYITYKSKSGSGGYVEEKLINI